MRGVGSDAFALILALGLLVDDAMISSSLADLNYSFGVYLPHKKSREPLELRGLQPQREGMKLHGLHKIALDM